MSRLATALVTTANLALPTAISAQTAETPAIGFAPVEEIFADRPIAVPGEYLIDTTLAPQADFSAGVLEAQGLELLDTEADLGIRLVRTDDPVNVTSFMADLGIPDGAVPNYLLYQDALPADSEAHKLWMIDAINARAAWQVASDASEVVVAVVDSGVYLDHEDLAGNLWTNAGEVAGNGVDDDDNGFIDDIHGWNFGDGNNDPNPRIRCTGDNPPRNDGPSKHGTHVAGTVGAVGGNGVGVIGVAPKVRIMAVRIERSDVCRGLPLDAILKGVAYAALNGADIINLSLGGPFKPAIAQRIYERVGDLGVLLVIAAGNDGIDNDSSQPYGLKDVRVQTKSGPKTVEHIAAGPSFPASFDLPHKIAVAATRAGNGGAEFVDAWGPVQWLNQIVGLKYNAQGGLDTSEAKIVPVEQETPMGSNYGATKMEIAAPGQQIFSTIPTEGGGGLAAGYDFSSGTSMATPAVAGAAALVKAAFPDLTGVQVKERLMATASPQSSLNGRVRSGHLDLYAALCAPGAPRALDGCDGAAVATDEPPAQPEPAPAEPAPTTITAQPQPAAPAAPTSLQWTPPSEDAAAVEEGGGEQGEGDVNINELFQ